MARILVVDDDPDMTEACKLVLEQAGHEVATARNVEEGHAALEQFAPELMILDVMMVEPDDGIAMAQKLRREGCKLPIVMLTSVSKVTGMSFDRDDTMVPVDEFIEKPVAPATLIEKVEALLSQKEGSRC